MLLCCHDKIGPTKERAPHRSVYYIILTLPGYLWLASKVRNLASYFSIRFISFFLLPFLEGMSLMAINPVAEDEIDISSVRGSKKSLKTDWTYEEEEPSEAPSDVDRASSRASSMAPIVVVDRPDPDMVGVTIDVECNL